MVFPKSVLFSGAFAGLARPLRFWTQEGKMQITKSNVTVLDILFIDLATRASGKSPAEWSLKVTELDDGDRSLRIALEMPGLSHNHGHQLFRVR